MSRLSVQFCDTKCAPLLQAGDDETVGTSVGGAELANKRIDGAKGKVAPLLRGEGNWPDKGTHLSFTRRIFLCVDALLSDLPFWFKVCPSPAGCKQRTFPGPLDCSAIF